LWSTYRPTLLEDCTWDGDVPFYRRRVKPKAPAKKKDTISDWYVPCVDRSVGLKIQGFRVKDERKESPLSLVMEHGVMAVKAEPGVETGIDEIPEAWPSEIIKSKDNVTRGWSPTAEGRLLKRRFALKPLTYKMKSRAPLWPGDNLRLLGQDVDLPAGSRPFKVQFPERVNAFALGDLCDGSKMLDNYSTFSVGASWSTTWMEFNKYRCDEKFDGDYKSLLDVFEHVDTRVPFISRVPEPSDCFGIKIKAEASAGMMFEHMLGIHGKGAGAATIAKLVEARYNEVKLRPMGDAPLWLAGGRERTYKIEEGKALRARHVWIDDADLSVFNRMFMQPVMQAVMRDPIHKICNGHSAVRQGYLKFQREFDGACVLEGDWSSFDQRVREEQLVVAMGWVRSAYPRSKALDNIFLHMTALLCFRNLATPGGYVYQFIGGMPSGSGWTALLDSVINMITLYQFHLEMDPVRDLSAVRMMVGGDDFLTDTARGAPLTPEDLGRWAKRRWGWKLKMEAARMGPLWNLSDPDDFATFYGEGVWNGLPARRLDRCIDNWLQPNFRIDCELWRRSQIMKIAQIAPFNRKVLKYAQYLFSFGGTDPKRDKVRPYQWWPAIFDDQGYKRPWLFKTIEDAMKFSAVNYTLRPDIWLNKADGALEVHFSVEPSLAGSLLLDRAIFQYRYAKFSEKIAPIRRRRPQREISLSRAIDGGGPSEDHDGTPDPGGGEDDFSLGLNSEGDSGIRLEDIILSGDRKSEVSELKGLREIPIEPPRRLSRRKSMISRLRRVVIGLLCCGGPSRVE
jgi:hypothetical protein